MPEPTGNPDPQGGPAGKGKVVVAVAGGVAAYKSAILVSKLVQSGTEVQTVLTDAGATFLGEATLEALSRRPVARRMPDSRWPLGPHIELARWADLLCVAPATANFLAKAAAGVADDLLSTLYLAVPCSSVLVAPAMNSEMWEHPAVQRNVQRLREDGVRTVGPDEGWLSCRTRGAGRMAEPEAILEALTPLLSR